MAEAKKVDLSEFRRIRKPGCTFAQLDFTQEQLEKLRIVMPSTDYSTRGIHEVLTSKWGFSIAEESLRKHRDGKCLCQTS